MSNTFTVTRTDGTQDTFNLDQVKEFSIDMQVLQETEESARTRLEFISDSAPHVLQMHLGPLRYIKIAAEVAP